MAVTWEELEAIQPIVLKMISNSLVKNRIAHAYLFEGMRGTGKRETGLLLAKSLFCLSPKEDVIPCEECKIVKELTMGIILTFIL